MRSSERRDRLIDDLRTSVFNLEQKFKVLEEYIKSVIIIDDKYISSRKGKKK